MISENNNNISISYDILSDRYKNAMGKVETKSIFDIDKRKVVKYITSSDPILGNIFLLRALENRDMKCEDSCRTHICDLFIKSSFELRYHIKYYSCSYRICNNMSNITFKDFTSLRNLLHHKYTIYDSIIPFDIMYSGFVKRIKDKIQEIKSTYDVELLKPEYIISHSRDNSIVDVMEKFLDFDIKLSLSSVIKIKLNPHEEDSNLIKTSIFSSIYLEDMDVETFVSNDDPRLKINY